MNANKARGAMAFDLTFCFFFVKKKEKQEKNSQINKESMSCQPAFKK